MRESKRIAIIVLNWNNLKDTIECLETIKELTYPCYDVIIIDNASKGNDFEIIKKKYSTWAHTLRTNKNYGYAGGNNIGILYAMKKMAPDYILLLNNDVIVHRDFLTELVIATEGEEKIGIASPLIYSYHTPSSAPLCGGYINMWTGRRKVIGYNEFDKDRHEQQMVEVDYVSGAALLIKDNVLKLVGLLDEHFFAYTEDVDYCYRAKKVGFRIVCVPKAKIWHKIASSTGGVQSSTVLYFTTRNPILFMKKHAKFYHWVVFLPLSFFYFVKRLIDVLIRHPEKLKILVKSALDGFMS